VNYVVTVNPIPDIAASDKTICSGASSDVAITNPNGVAGTSFSWVVQSMSNVNGASAGSGNVISQVLTSSDGTSDGTVVYRVTPSANGCPGSFLDVTVTVKPVPVFTNPATDFALQICSGEPLNFLPSTTIAGSTVTWTSSVSGPIDPASVSVGGTGAITDNPVNNGNVSGTVTYRLTPGFNGCNGPGADLVVLVRPLPSATATDLTICSGQNAVLNISPAPRNVAGTTFSWTATPSANVTGAADGNGSTINQTLNTIDANIGTVVYSIVPAANGCNGTPVNVTVTVNPVAIVSAGADFAVCEPLTIPIVGILGGSSTSGTWSIVSGLGTLSPSIVSGSTVTSTYTVDPSEIGNTVVFRITTDDPDGTGPCSLVSDEVAVAIHRQAQVIAPADYEVCEPGTLMLTGTLGGSATSGSWSVVSGTGTLSISSVTGTAVTATYIIDPSEVGSVVTFRLTTNDPDDTAGPCVAESDDVNITINESPKVDAGPDAEVCEDAVVQLSGSIFGSATSATWSGGSGPAQFGDVNDPLSTYTLTSADILAGSITLVLTTNDPDGTGPCTNVSDQVVITINRLPAVFLSGLQASYAENDPPVNMEGFPSGGTFTGPGVLAGTNVFDPGTANIGFNTITYTYTDPDGCTNFAERIVVVNEVTTTDFGIFNGSAYDFSPTPEICANIGRAYLRGIPDYATGFTPTFFSSPDVPSRIGLDATGYYLDTDGLISGQYYIQYTYTNEFNATSVLIKRVTVYAAPVAAIDAANACEEVPVQFTDLSTIPGNTLGGSITEWLWDFDDQDLLNSTQNPTYIFQDADVYDVTLTVTTDQGCTNTATRQIIIGPPPVVDFDWSGICSTQGTQFSNTSTISGGFSSIESFQWDFGDGDITALDLAGNPIPPGTHGGRTSGTYRDPNHLFATFSEYNVRLTAMTDVGCVQDTVKRVYILDYPAATPTLGYFEDFEGGNGTWFRTSLTGTSWVLGTPSGETINATASGSQAWWTGSNPDAATDNSTYFNNEQSEVIGPCLDLSGLERPMVSLNYWTDAQDGFDGTVLQYSVNGGASWETIGDADGGGIEWYNRTNLNGNPGGQDNFAWSASSLAWKNARYSLDDIPSGLRQKVIFRIAFGANDDNLQGSVLNGFAFDDIYIGERKRNVLVEHFTNKGGTQPATTDAEAYFNNLFEQRPLNESNFIKLEYHISNPGLDSINLHNPAAPQARSLFYGVSQPPAAVMDGILGDYYGTIFNGNPFAISSVHLDRRSLEDPPFNIELDTLATSGDKIRGQVRIEYADTTQVQTEPVIVQVALVDSVVNNEGLQINQQWQAGVTFVHDFEENIDVPINESTAHYLVAFVQDKTTRRIHQAIVKLLVNKQGVRPVGLPDDPVMAEIRDIAIYPNPASNVLYFNLPNRLTKDFTWNLVDQRGVTVLDGDVNRSFDQPQAVDISQVANGIYFMKINSGNRTLIYRKIAVMNRN
jgi:PKD repeat protein